MQYRYILAPFFGWIVADLLKSLITSIKTSRWRFEPLSYGGFPSSHASVACTTTTLIGFREGFDTPAYGLALTVTVLFIVDALQLRRWVGQHAKALNALRVSQADLQPLRESVGHTPVEILGGIVLGFGCGTVLHWLN
ncbi:MAG: divergent PAP2 family protein [Planctomycetia bacterium]|nr:divergent PAP2 family protein [Planctomycetia bacterium]